MIAPPDSNVPGTSRGLAIRAATSRTLHPEPVGGLRIAPNVFDDLTVVLDDPPIIVEQDRLREEHVAESSAGRQAKGGPDRYEQLRLGLVARDLAASQRTTFAKQPDLDVDGGHLPGSDQRSPVLQAPPLDLLDARGPGRERFDELLAFGRRRRHKNDIRAQPLALFECSLVLCIGSPFLCESVETSASLHASSLTP